MALKNRTKVGTSLKNEVNEKLEKLHQATNIPKSKLFDEAIEDLYQKYKENFNFQID
ncbi:MAG: ribbon-helix-helix domain-containing protein [Bacillota bacterium]